MESPNGYEYAGWLSGPLSSLKKGGAISIDNEAERLPLFIPKPTKTRAEGTLKDIPDTHWGYIPKIPHPAAGFRSISVPNYDADSETIGLLFSWDPHWKTTGISGNQLPHPAASDFNDYLPLDMVIVLGPPTPSSSQGTSDVKRPILQFIDDWDELQDDLLADEMAGINTEIPWWTPHLRGLVWRKLVQREINPESLRMIASRDLSRWIPQFLTTQWNAILNWQNFPEDLL